MKLTYDATVDALDIRLLVDAEFARTEQLDEGTLVDIDPNARVIAIEVIAPSRRWPLHEILERFGVDSEDETILRDLFGGEGRYPFSGQRLVESGASGAAVLVA